jgi:hypothetical protein
VLPRERERGREIECITTTNCTGRWKTTELTYPLQLGDETGVRSGIVLLATLVASAGRRAPPAAQRPPGREGTSCAKTTTCRCTPRGTGACTGEAAAPSRRAAPCQGRPSTAPRRHRRSVSLTRCTRAPAAWRCPRRPADSLPAGCRRRRLVRGVGHGPGRRLRGPR